MTTQVKDDPVRPYKMYAAIVAAVLTSIVTNEALNLPVWGDAGITATLAGIAVYLVPNPKVAS